MVLVLFWYSNIIYSNALTIPDYISELNLTAEPLEFSTRNW